MVTLRPVLESDADHLFSLVHKTPVTETVLWDGPTTFEGYKDDLRVRSEKTRNGEIHAFTILESSTNTPIGSLSVRPYEEKFRGDVGLWIGLPYQGKGYGSKAIRLATEYGFTKLGFLKIEAAAFVGNTASRRIFEKNGFKLEGTLRRCVLKRGRYLDEWVLGLLKEEFEALS
jgi:ribosomal-protein-alanine N-acetyltransferase